MSIYKPLPRWGTLELEGGTVIKHHTVCETAPCMLCGLVYLRTDNGVLCLNCEHFVETGKPLVWPKSTRGLLWKIPSDFSWRIDGQQRSPQVDGGVASR
jgi:hypothetical protein